MSRRIKLFLIPLISICLLLSIVFLPPFSNAHSPNSMTLSYDISQKQLSVTITHSVSAADHFIESVEISVNGSNELTETYTSQASDTFTYTFNINASVGATIGCTAFCSRTGSLSKSLVVDEGGGDPDYGGEIPGFSGILLVLSAIIFISGIYFYKKRI